jgi:subtilisin family serine protease
MARRIIVLFTLALALVTQAAVARPALVLGRYIVTLRDSVSDPAAVAHLHGARFGARINHVYSHALKGYSTSLPEVLVAALSRDPRVVRIERDGIMRADTTQAGATWGLDRVDQHALPLTTTYTYFVDGAGVHVYIIDTGIHLGHTEFIGRLAPALS